MRHLVDVWGLKEDEASVPDHLQPLRPFKYRYAAEVHDTFSLRSALVLAQNDDKLRILNDIIIPALGDNLWFIWYYFMYPGHVEDITQAEFKALALRKQVVMRVITRAFA